MTKITHTFELDLETTKQAFNIIETEFIGLPIEKKAVNVFELESTNDDDEMVINRLEEAFTNAGVGYQIN